MKESNKTLKRRKKKRKQEVITYKFVSILHYPDADLTLVLAFKQEQTDLYSFCIWISFLGRERILTAQSFHFNSEEFTIFYGKSLKLVLLFLSDIELLFVTDY